MVEEHCSSSFILRNEWESRMKDLNMFSSTSLSYGPDNYFVFSDINNGQNVYTIGYRISIYKVLPYDLDTIYDFKFVPPLQSVQSKIERPNNKGGRIIVADTDKIIENRCEIIRGISQKKTVSYYEINHEEMYKDLVNLNIEEIQQFAGVLNQYNIPLKRDTFGYSIEYGDLVEDDVEDEFGNKDTYQTYDAWLGCMPEVDKYSKIINGYHEFSNHITTCDKDTKYMKKIITPMNCYILSLVDTCEFTTRDTANYGIIEKIADHLSFYNYVEEDPLHQDIRRFFELRKCGVSLDFLFEFVGEDLVYQISPICIDDEAKQYGPIYGSRELL